jgi:hypothetical protein
MSKIPTPWIIACTGTRVDPKCARVIANFGHNGENAGYYFVMKEWLSEDRFRRSLLLWVVDSSTPCDDIDPALRYAIPLLVPEESAGLKQLCVRAKCGIWYRDEVDARLCLEYLLKAQAIREQLGANGQAYAAASEKEGRGDRTFAAAAR